MKKTTILLGLLMAAAVFEPVFTDAEASTEGTGTIQFTGKYERSLKDPENPEENVDPGDSPFTTGDLRMDFVPELNFGANKISDKDQLYSVDAQLFQDDTNPRGNFIQISDFRGEAAGWTLQVRQEIQFQNPKKTTQQLDGAVISFDHSWVNSTRSMNEAPLVSKDIVRIDNIGETYNLAEAKKGTGQGTWEIIFGTSKENRLKQPSTLKAKITEDGQPIYSADYNNKQVYENSAIQLFVPGKTKKDPVTYQTVVTWILSELP